MWVAAIGEAAERPVGYLGELAALFGRSTRALFLSPLAWVPAPLHSPVAVMAAFTVCCCGVYAALAVFWTLPPSFLGGTAAAGGIALINSISNLGGFFGPAIMGWLKQHTGSFTAGMGVLAAGMIVSAILVIAIGRTLSFAGRAAALERYTRLNARY